MRLHDAQWILRISSPPSNRTRPSTRSLIGANAGEMYWLTCCRRARNDIHQFYKRLRLTATSTSSKSSLVGNSLCHTRLKREETASKSLSSISLAFSHAHRQKLLAAQNSWIFSTNCVFSCTKQIKSEDSSKQIVK